MENKTKIYEIGIVYMLKELQSGIYYIGWSGNFKKRKLNHKWDFFNDKNKDGSFYLPFYVKLRQIWKTISDCKDYILEEIWNIPKQELKKIENEYIEKNLQNELCFNKYKSYVEDQKKYYKEYNYNYRLLNKDKLNEYRLLNKDILNEYWRKYWLLNKELLNEKQRDKIFCQECNIHYNKWGKTQHMRTKKHITNVNKSITTINNNNCNVYITYNK